MKNIFSLIIITILFGSCTSSISLRILKPADITLPQEIQKFTLVNRTKPDKKNKLWNIIEGAITGEGIFADREGADYCLSGLMEIMQQTPRYTITQAAVEFKGSGTELFSNPLSWDEVNALCTQNNSEALIVLEAFDSDSRLTYDSKPIQIKGASFDCWDTNKNKKNDSSEDTNKDGKWNSLDCATGSPTTITETTTTTEFYTHAQIEVKTGWRIYYPKEKQIVEEYRFSDFMNFNGKGFTPEQATFALPNKRDCIKNTGHKAGATYGFRISPQWIYTTRYFYTRGSKAMKLAGKRIRQIDDWKGAIETWKKETLNAKRKVARNACFNMAVASEHEGNLEVALEWANKAYNIGQKSVAGQYINTLNFRIAQEKRLKEQMQGK